MLAAGCARCLLYFAASSNVRRANLEAYSDVLARSQSPSRWVDCAWNPATVWSWKQTVNQGNSCAGGGTRGRRAEHAEAKGTWRRHGRKRSALARNSTSAEEMNKAVQIFALEDGMCRTE